MVDRAASNHMTIRVILTELPLSAVTADCRRGTSYGLTASMTSPRPGSPERELGRPVRKRASRPKVRTGCGNCKQRHLKCDEKKPYCSRCDDFGIHCQGYPDVKVGKGTRCFPKRVQRSLLPQPQPFISTPTAAASHAQVGAIRKTRAVRGLPGVPVQVLHRSPALRSCLNGEDGRYLSFFLREVAGHLSPLSVSLREISSNTCILHAVLCIGACSRAVEEVRHESRTAQRTNAPTSNPRAHVGYSPWHNIRRSHHHRAALSHYSKAIEMLRGDLRMRADARAATIVTLLFIAFENMQGNSHSAGRLIRSGIKLIGSLSQHGPSDTAASYTDTNTNSSQSSSPVFPASRTSPSLCISSPLSSVSPCFSPSPRTSYATASSFQLPLNCQDGENTEIAQLYARHSTSSMFMPFPHCKYAYHMLIKAHPSEMMSQVGPGKCPLPLQDARSAWDFYLPSLAGFLQKCAWHNLNTAYDFDMQHATREQNDHLAWLSSFGTVLEPLRMAHGDNMVTWVSQPDGEQARYAMDIALLSLQHTAATVLTRCCLDPSELMYDIHLDRFGDILSRCRDLVPGMAEDGMSVSNKTDLRNSELSHSRGRLAFINDAGVLPILGFVGCKCRDLAMRQRVLSLLEGQHWREGSWDSLSLARGIRALMELEIKSMEFGNEFVPPSARFAWTNATSNWETKNLSLEFTRLLPAADGEYQKVQLKLGL